MHIIVIIVIVVIIFSLIGAFFEWVANGGWIILLGIGAMIGVFVLWSWKGVLIAIGVVLGGFILVKLFTAMGKFIGDQVQLHDEKVNERVRIKRQTQKEKHSYENENALINELNRNCYWLGYMNEEKWKKKLPNYIGKEYSSSFKQITYNFAKQIEEQHIVNNSEWFEAYILYVLKHPGGATVTKMLNEVDCPQLKMTHVTPNGDLINKWLIRRTKRISKDVPEMFRMTYLDEIKENIFTPTEYLKKLYSQHDEQDKNNNKNQEISFDDL